MPTGTRGAVQLDKHKVVQILVNLVQNAVQAMERAKVETPRLQLSLVAVDPGMISISVQDNGIGIEEGDQIRIFGHGYTTRDDGFGFGLHASANVAGELGGGLVVASDGEGQGACFTLTVPVGDPSQLEGRRSE